MLKISKDRKTAALATPNGKQASVANTLMLAAGKGQSCPDATAYCAEICYAGKLETMFPSLRGVVTHNTDLLKSADENGQYELLHTMIADFVKVCDRRNVDKVFRIHADGDFFSMDYVRAWSRIIADFPMVQFWVYTRVYAAALYLHNKHDNLGLYFSGDPDNINIAKRAASKGIKIAMLADTFSEAKDILAGIGQRGARCPNQNNKDFVLINKDGGACYRCGLCITGKGSVLFSKRGK